MGTPYTLAVKLKADTAAFSSGIGGAIGVINKWATDSKSAIGQVTKSFGPMGTAATVGGAAIVAGAIAGGKALYDLGASFEENYRRIRMATGAQGKELDALKEDYKNLYQALPTVSAKQITDTIIQLNTLYNIHGKELENLSTYYLRFSKYTGTDAKMAIESLTSAFNAFGIATRDQPKYLDLLLKLTQDYGISGEKLTSALQTGAPAAKILGLSMEQFAISLAKVNREGYDAGKVATALNKGLVALSSIDPKKALKAFEGFPDLFKQFSGTNDPAVRMQAVQEAVKRMQFMGKPIGDIINFLKQMGFVSGKTGPAVVSMFTGGAVSAEEAAKAMKQARGTTDQTAESMNNVSAKVTKMGRMVAVALEPVATAFYRIVGAILDYLMPALEVVIGFIRDHNEILKVLGIIVGVVLVAAIYLLAAGLWILLAPIITVTAAIGLLWAYWDTIWKAITDAFSAAWDFMAPIFSEIVYWLTVWILGGLLLLYENWNTIWNTIYGVLLTVWDGIQAVFWGIVNWFTGLPGFLLGALGDGLSLFIQWGTNILLGLWNGALYGWSLFWGWFIGIPMYLLSLFIDAVSWLYNAGVSVIQGLFTGAVEKAGEFFGWIAGIPGQVIGVIQEAIGNIWDGLKSIGASILHAIIEGIKGAAGGVWDAIKGTVGGAIRHLPGGGAVADLIGLQGGGRAAAGQPFIVGEKGPELFVPGTTGTVIPNTAFGPGMEGGGVVGIPPASAAQDLASQSLAITEQYAKDTLGTVQQSATDVLANQTVTDAAQIQAMTDTMMQLNAIWLFGMAQLVATTNQQFAVMNQNTQLHFFFLVALVQGTMNQVVQTMTLGAATAAQSFVDQLNARLPPLIQALAAYSIQVITYGRDFLRQIGAPVSFQEGGINQAQIAPGGSWRVWAEPGTGGEAYIPRYGANNPLNVLRTAAAWYGYGVVPMQLGGLAELFWEANGGSDWKNGRNIGWSIGGHGDHVHAAGPPWEQIQAYLWGQGIPARPTSTREGKHAAGSYHYSGRAVDYGNSVNNVGSIYFALLPFAGGPGGLGMLLPNPATPAPPDFGPGVPAQQAHAMGQIMQLNMQKKLQDIRDYMQAAMMSAAGGGGSGPLADYAKSLFPLHGWGLDQWGALDAIIQHESGWNPNARNPSSGAWGLFQFLGKGPFDPDPYSQIRRGLDYIAGRYGNPAAAWAFWQAHHWYRQGGLLTADNGTTLRPGWNLRYNGTGADESLVPAGQGIQVNLGGVTVNGLMDRESAQFKESVDFVMEEAARQVEQAARRAMS